MRFEATAIPGVTTVVTEPVVDERGSFVRIFDRAEFADRGAQTRVEQVSLSFNSARATLRGLHLQRAPHQEHKLIRCVRGRIFDVLVDLRPRSATFATWVGIELGGERSVVVPPGVAHGFVTLEAGSEVLYQISTAYEPAAAVGLRWDDPDVGVRWPVAPEVMSDRDRALPYLEELRPMLEEA